jgi:hypothetical protein
MNVGAAEIDVTPAVGVELSGYAARLQPAVGVLDPIFVRAIFIEDDNQRLLWLSADVIALPQAIVESFRGWARQELQLDASQVLLSATHTHAAPATISLTGCGRCSEAFLLNLRDGMKHAARQAMARPEPCRVAVVQQELRLAIDRRNMPSAHVDPIVTAVGFVRVDGTFLAACLNYAMHRRGAEPREPAHQRRLARPRVGEARAGAAGQADRAREQRRVREHQSADSDDARGRSSCAGGAGRRRGDRFTARRGGP